MSGERKIDELKSGLTIFAPNFLQGYRERVEQYYKNEETTNPLSFPLINPCLIVFVVLHEEVFVVLAQSNRDECLIVEATEKNEEDIKNLRDIPNHVFEDIFLEIFKIDKDKVISFMKFYELNYYDEFFTIGFSKENRHSLANRSIRGGAKKADFDFSNLELQASIRKATISSSNYPLFDIKPIISMVADVDFQYEFEESIKAYNSDLYLSSIVTAAVSLETLLKLVVIRKLGEKYLPKEDKLKHTLMYAKILLNNNVIDERVNHRIRSLNELRRSAAHSKTGKVEQWDAEQMISGIKIIVDYIFGNN